MRSESLSALTIYSSMDANWHLDVEKFSDGYDPGFGDLNETTCRLIPYNETGYIGKASHCIWLRFEVDERKLNSSYYKKQLEHKLRTLGYKPTGQEKKQIQQQVKADCLATENPKTKTVRCLYSPDLNVFAFLTSSTKQVDEIVHAMFEINGTFPFRPIEYGREDIEKTMTNWLRHYTDNLSPDLAISEPYSLGTRLTLHGLKDKRASLNAISLESSEMKEHLDSGMKAEKLSIFNEDKYSFTLDIKLRLTSIKMEPEYRTELYEESFESGVYQLVTELVTLLDLEFRSMEEDGVDREGEIAISEVHEGISGFAKSAIKI